MRDKLTVIGNSLATAQRADPDAADEGRPGLGSLAAGDSVNHPVGGNSARLWPPPATLCRAMRPPRLPGGAAIRPFSAR